MKQKQQPVIIMDKQQLIEEMKQMLKDQERKLLHEVKTRKNDELFTRAELAKYLKVSQQTIINWAIRGILHPVYIGSRVYYKADEVNELLK
jgi:excisionase family DNA binding protein